MTLVDNNDAGAATDKGAGAGKGAGGGQDRDAGGRFAGKGGEGGGDPAAAAAEGKGGDPAAAAAVADKGKPAKTIAAGAEPVVAAVAADFPENWKERVARGRLASELGLEPDKVPEDRLKKELNRLKNYTSPTDLWGKTASLESRFSAGNFIERPGPKATPEERAKFWQELGAPEKPEQYADKIALPNNKVLGEADKAMLTFIAPLAHTEGVTVKQMGTLTNAMLEWQEAVVAQREEDDIANRAKNERTLRGEWGANYDPYRLSIATYLKDVAPPEIAALLSEARLANGELVGSDPGLLKWFVPIVEMLLPSNENREGGAGKTRADRLAEIRAKEQKGERLTAAEDKERLDIIEAQVADKNRRRA